MAQPPDQAPVSSYSDPIYDRLDTLAQRVKRQWFVFAIGLVVVIVGTVVVRHLLDRQPDAAGAFAYHDAIDETDQPKRLEKLAAVAKTGESPVFAAIAGIDLCQAHLDQGKVDEARAAAQQAIATAKTTSDFNVQLAAELSLAAVEYQAGAFPEAEKAYRRCSDSAGSKFPSHQLTAQIGLANAIARQGRVDDAIALLEPLTTRKDLIADDVLRLARTQYWSFKRQQAEAKMPKPAVADPAAPGSAAPGTAGQPPADQPPAAAIPAAPPATDGTGASPTPASSAEPADTAPAVAPAPAPVAEPKG